ncbi:mechanosensitive ion channel family protein [Candidatus Peregrinibacteria bacterium]|nr:mechanosensitive ion channel family protein [Candidatus Peregrinibacteria bacterium]
MFLEKLIPTAYAQFTTTIKDTAVAGKDVAVEGSEAGIQSLLSYVASNIDNWIAGVVIIVIFYILAKMGASALKAEIIKKKGDDVQESVLILVERMTTILVVTIGATIALAINGLNFTAVIGALSLGIGFALKDIIGNFISGIIMLSQDRVRIGDFIKVSDILGTIVSIDTRATILQAVDGTEVVIPNQTMLGQTVISYSTNPFRRIELIVGVDYGTDLPMVTSLIKGVIDRDRDIVPKPESIVIIDEFSDSSINIKILFWIESNKNWMKIRSNLANKIKKAFNELNINIPFPIRTLKLDEDDRSFLKTMDSMKKGEVPEKKGTPDSEKVILTAANTAFEKEIPYNIFGDKEKVPNAITDNIIQSHAKTQATTQAENEAPQSAPQPTTQPVAAGVVPEEKKVEPTPPPTHI